MADKRRSVFGEPEAETFRLLLAAIAAPSSATGVRAALLTPAFGLDAGTLARLADGEFAATVIPPPPAVETSAPPVHAPAVRKRKGRDDNRQMSFPGFDSPN